MKHLIFGIFILIAQLGHAQSNCAPQLPTDICAFENKVYTETDFKKTKDLKQVMVELKNLLMKYSSGSALVQDHILTLGGQIVEEAYNQRAPKSILALADGKRNLLDMLKKLRKWEAKHGQIVPLDWQLPKGFTIGITALTRSYDVSTDRLRFAVSFFSILDRSLEIEQFKVSRYGGSVVIDKAAGIGDWNQGLMSWGDRPYVSAGSSHQDSPMQDGLYLMNIKIKGQKVVEGWFFLHGASTTSPVVMSPQVNQKYTTANPIFNFQDFTSSFISPSDSRKLTVSIFHEGDNKQVWNTSYINPKNITSVTLGQDGNQFGDKALVSGSYRMNLAFEERSYFGDLTIGRVINTTVPFGIAK